MKETVKVGTENAPHRRPVIILEVTFKGTNSPH